MWFLFTVEQAASAEEAADQDPDVDVVADSPVKPRSSMMSMKKRKAH